MTALLNDLSITDRYDQRAGRVHLTGIQALARLPIDQARRDRAAGLRVGTYISGYEGSPLGGYDLELARQTRLLDEHDIRLRPGLNEELAATAVQGSQLIDGLAPRVDGVVGIWYGKAPGLDRATDALRHANLMGTHPRGGAVALVGDDPAAKSSTVPCASELALADLGMPTFFPADAEEILELGRHAIALSRASGLWTALKIVTAVADGSATIDLLADPEPPVFPAGSHRHEPTAKLLQPMLGPLERDFHTTRLRIVNEYAELNRLNRIIGAGVGDRVGVVAAGKSYLDVLEALGRLGVDLDSAPVRLLKVGLVWPLTADTVREFAEGLDEIIVVEEKRAFLEGQLREILYDAPHRPTITGKSRPDGATLLAAHGELDADAIAVALRARLAAHGVALSAPPAPRTGPIELPLVRRAPYFCSGCPHSTSTKTRVDSPVGAGIGCHTMVLLMDPKQVGEVAGITQMGGEGTQWLGAAPFVGPAHFVQNLGDGTFHHSGSLAIRAAVAAGVNITYRLLYNGTVAMTGGQQAVGEMDLSRLVANLRSEGVRRIIVTTDDVRRVRALRLPGEVRVLPRARIAEAERALAATPGVTVLIHAQDCATELRRKRKRGKAAVPRQSVVINERLCEGCGDCGEKSNCLSVHPVPTEYGRKTAIHHSSCNTDLTCLSGDCPAFMVVTPGTSRGTTDVAELDAADLAAPAPSPVRDQRIRLIGIGGTGIVTTSQILATAAALAGRHVRTLDQTGLAQKGGAVVSDVTIAAEPIAAGNKIGAGRCDLYLGYDVLTASEPGQLSTLAPSATAVVSTSMVPTGAMVSDKEVGFPDVAERLGLVEARLPEGRLVSVDAHAVVEALFGAEQFANMFLLGIAYQRGALALPAEAIERAITLNGVAVPANVQAFRRGRQHVLAPDELAAAVRARRPERAAAPHRQPTIVDAPAGSELERLVAIRGAELLAYQDERYALRYERLVERTRAAEAAIGADDHALSEAVARYYYKLLAYKDEYEVARLALAPEVRDSVRTRFGRDARTAWKLHPPSLRALGLRRKLTLGAWFTPVFRILYALRVLRGTAFDPFGRARVRRVERELIAEYEAAIAGCVDRLTPDNRADAVRLAELPDRVRGYEDVKLRSVDDYRARLRELTERIGVPR